MPQSRNQRGFGFLPPLPEALNSASRNIGQRARSMAADADAAANAAYQTAKQLGRRAQNDLEKAGLLPPSQRGAQVSGPSPRKTAVPTSTGSRSGDRPISRVDARPPTFLPQPIERTAASIKAMQNAIFLDQDDKIIAALKAIPVGNSGAGIVDRFQNELEKQKDFSRRLEQAHPLSSSAGATTGLGAGLLMGGPISLGRSVGATALKAATRRAPPKQPMPRLQTKAREHATVAGVNGLLTTTSEAGIDAVTGRRGTLGDYAGTGIGATVGSLGSTLAGPRVGGAVEGAVTSVAQSLLNGQALSAKEIRDRALVGASYGNLGAVEGARFAEGLTRRQKGELGELLSKGKTLARFEVPRLAQKAKVLADGSRTIMDHVTSTGDIVEAKFGEWARLSAQQRKALREFADQYRVDYWRAKDVGNVAGSAAGKLASHQFDER